MESGLLHAEAGFGSLPHEKIARHSNWRVLGAGFRSFGFYFLCTDDRTTDACKNKGQSAGVQSIAGTCVCLCTWV